MQNIAALQVVRVTDRERMSAQVMREITTIEGGLVSSSSSFTLCRIVNLFHFSQIKRN